MTYRMVIRLLDSQGTRGFRLTDIHRLQSASDDFCHIRGTVNSAGDETNDDKMGPIELNSKVGFQQLRQAICQNEHLNHQWCTSQHVHVGRCNSPQNPMFGHFCNSDKKTDNQSGQHRY